VYFQTTDLEVTLPESEEAVESKGSPDRDIGTVAQPKLQLIVRGPNLPGVNDVEVELNDPEKSIFHAVQHIIQVRF
jgi:E3 ubiquitin-protein ligase HECTD1